MTISVLLTSGCGVKKENKDSNKKLVVGEMWKIDSIDPSTSGTLTTEKAMITETLVGVKENFELKPGLATEWKRIDANTWSIVLRQGVKFHDGTPMDGEAVKWSLMRAIAVNPQVQTFTKIKSIEVENDHTLKITTTAPTGDFPASLHYMGASVIAPSSVDKAGKLIKPIGTGPFMLEQFEASTGDMEMAKYKDYWGTPAKLEKLEIRPLPDPNTRALALEKGEIDFTCDPPYNELERLGKEKGLKVELNPTARTYIVEMNLKKEPFNDVRVRKALSYAIDRESITKHVLFGCGTPAKGPFMPGMAWTNENLKGYPYSPGKAKLLLEEAGWKDTDGDGIIDKNGQPLKITLMTYPQRPGLPPMAQALQDQFKQAGIDLKIEIMENSAMSQVASTGKWDMKMSAFATAMIPTPSYHLQVLYYSENNKLIGYNNAKVDQLIDECVAVDDQQKKYELSKQVQQILEDEVPVLPIAYYGVAAVMNSKIENFVFNPTAHDYMLTTEVGIKE
jgi:peptide/nickel transport system substrate-binding protein